MQLKIHENNYRDFISVRNSDFHTVALGIITAWKRSSLCCYLTNYCFKHIPYLRLCFINTSYVECVS